MRKRVLILALIAMSLGAVAADLASTVWSRYPMIASFISGALALAFTLFVVDGVLERREARRVDVLLAHHAELLAEETNECEKEVGRMSRKRPTADELQGALDVVMRYRALLVALSPSLIPHSAGLQLLEAARGFVQELERIVREDFDNAHFGMPPEDRATLAEARRSVHRVAWPLYERHLAEDKRRDRLGDIRHRYEYVTGDNGGVTRQTPG